MNQSSTAAHRPVVLMTTAPDTALWPPDYPDRDSDRDATSHDFFGTTAEVHPAEFIQLRLQMVYFALPVAQLFLQGVDQRFLFGQALFRNKL
nr:hypothetical protein [Escherichia coli]